ncbi:MAG: hypothetical protein WCJ30_25675, partial [Deltaproteobacteria bacterium]
HRVFVQGPMPFFRVWVSAGSDTTLLVRAPNGQIFCADDTWSTNPGVDIMGAMPGAYEVFVGSYAAGNTAPYTVGFSENRASTPAAGGAMAMPPGVIVQPNPGLGYAVPPQPVQPNGYPIQPGYAVPVPPPQLGYGGGYPLATGFMPDPRMFSGLSGGSVSAQAVSPQCRGYIGQAPNQAITLTTPFNFLRLWVRSQGDTTLVVRAPTGQIYCADDTYGINPGVDMTGLPPGTYQVFVGSYSPGARFPYELGATEMPSSTPQSSMGGMGNYQPQPQPQPQPGYGQANPGYGAIALTSGFLPDPQMRPGMSGGPISAMSMNSQCRGYVDSNPDHMLYLNSPFNFLRIYVSSSSDTTLMVRGPSGEVYCADDTYGTNPAVDLQGAMPGMYQVFVGSYSQGNSSPYTVGFTEMPNVHP